MIASFLFSEAGGGSGGLPSVSSSSFAQDSPLFPFLSAGSKEHTHPAHFSPRPVGSVTRWPVYHFQRRTGRMQYALFLFPPFFSHIIRPSSLPLLFLWSACTASARCQRRVKMAGDSTFPLERKTPLPLPPDQVRKGRSFSNRDRAGAVLRRLRPPVCPSSRTAWPFLSFFPRAI